MERLTHASRVSNRAATPVINQSEPFQANTTRAPSNRFRLMVVHDSQQNLDAEIDDLKSSGFPANTEVLLLTVADLFRAPLYLAPGDLPDETYYADTRLSDHDGPCHHSETFRNLEHAAQRARAKLLAAFPLWDVHCSVSARPSRVVLEQALRWQPDLLAVAPAYQSIARSRAFRGIMRKLVTESQISLRVLRAQSEIWPCRRPTIVAFDGPESAKAILTALPRRPMARGCDIRLLFCAEPLINNAARTTPGDTDLDSEWVAGQLLRTKAAIETLGHKVRSLVPIGNTAQAILDEARRVNAECILIGKGHRDIISDLVAQSVAATVAANATCPVEIICAKPEQQAADARQNLAA